VVALRDKTETTEILRQAQDDEAGASGNGGNSDLEIGVNRAGCPATAETRAEPENDTHGTALGKRGYNNRTAVGARGYSRRDVNGTGPRSSPAATTADRATYFLFSQAMISFFW
jgi:hypothetical protein